MEQDASQGWHGDWAEAAGLRLAAIPGATPDKWAGRWRRRHPELELAVDYYDDAGQMERVRCGTADVGYVRALAESTAPAVDQPGEPGEQPGRAWDSSPPRSPRPTSQGPAAQGPVPQQAEGVVARELADAVAAGEMHRVMLYREEPLVCAASDHWVAAAEESVLWEEIEEESFLQPEEMLQDYSGSAVGSRGTSGGEHAMPSPKSAAADPGGQDMARAPSMTGQEPALRLSSAASPADPFHTPQTGAGLARAERLALEVVASGAGLLILPSSVARMLSRKDVVLRRVEGLPGYDVALAWRRDRDDAVIQEFIGIARGRRPGSGRSELLQKSAHPKAGTKAPSKKAPPRRGRPSARRRRPR